jgi:hypothetical protein
LESEGGGAGAGDRRSLSFLLVWCASLCCRDRELDWVVGDKEGQWPWGKGLYLWDPFIFLVARRFNLSR